MKDYIELLAPAGSPDSFRAAVNAGADAVYLGGVRFGARAYAGNFDDEQLKLALEYAHLRNKKIYLTVNTLFRDDELEDLYDYILPFYREGLDAVIVQDFGAFDLIKNEFPMMDIHASTQMNITGVYGAKLLKSMGASRIVPARELDLSDIKAIDDEVDIEIETFVHGALCYGYSGQCLLSSMFGDRSGNRGRCAQPCRTSCDGRYPLNLKDMCALPILPEIVDAGVDSLKIEGRMKNSGYVATVVSVYRKYLDMVLSGEAYKVDDHDVISLMDVYNRGGFSLGYYKGKNNDAMVFLQRPNHQGVPCLKVVSQKGQDVMCEALVDINPGDIFQIDENFNYTYAKTVKRKGDVWLHVPKNYRLDAGTVINRTRNEALLKKMNEDFVEATNRIPIRGLATILTGCEARLLVWKDDVYYETVGDVVSKAAKSPLVEADVRRRLGKTGETDVYFEELEINLSEDAFLPVGRINELKRTAIEGLRNAICDGWKRMQVAEASKDTASFTDTSPDKTEKNNLIKISCHLDYISMDGWNDDKTKLGAVVETLCKSTRYNRVYIEEEAFGSYDEMRSCADKFRSAGKETFIALPHVMRRHTVLRLEEALKNEVVADGFLVHNLEAAAFVRMHLGAQLPMVADYGIYSMNRRARCVLKHIFPGILIDTANVELDMAQLKALGIESSEMLVYGHMTLMQAENCAYKTLNGCARLNPRSGSLVQRLAMSEGRSVFVVPHCKDCYTTVHDERTLWLLDCPKIRDGLKPASIRLCFTNEDGAEVADVLECAKAYVGGGDAAPVVMNFTHGHYINGSGVK